MDFREMIEMLFIDLTAEGGLGTIFAIVLLVAAFLGGGLNGIIEALVNLI